MIFCCGDTSLIKTDQWHVMELRSERTAEEILKRVLLALKPTFRDDPVEAHHGRIADHLVDRIKRLAARHGARLAAKPPEKRRVSTTAFPSTRRRLTH